MVWKYLFVTHIVNNLKQKEQFWVWPASSQNQIKVQLKKGALKKGFKTAIFLFFLPFISTSFCTLFLFYLWWRVSNKTKGFTALLNLLNK